mmetsp:Transcript_15250/g.34919  ORF Transcript_15250/g.34919 Transcript_15250/m.34919 type:complete len:102 (+) Transcript_15250:925-1230(+)
MGGRASFLLTILFTILLSSILDNTPLVQSRHGRAFNDIITACTSDEACELVSQSHLVQNPPLPPTQPIVSFLKRFASSPITEGLEEYGMSMPFSSDSSLLS